MAESTLALTYTDLAAEVGVFLGFGPGANAPYSGTAWTTDQQQRIDSCVKAGLTQFLYPPPLDGEKVSYDWNFLKPVGSVTISSASTTVPLPDDFGGFEGEIYLLASSGQSFDTVDVVPIGTIYAMQSQVPTRTGRPIAACVEPLKSMTGAVGQRQQLRIYPTTDQAYTLQFSYYLLPDNVNNGFPYAYGGAGHAQTILASCLAVAEQRLDDEQGPKWGDFMNKLAQSVNLDRKSKPQCLGYNGDTSDAVEYQQQLRRAWFVPITHNGVQY